LNLDQHTVDVMASVVFFRAVNVGSHQRFQPSSLAKRLADFGVVNLGAAGTFVVRQGVSQATLRAEILRRLSFKPELVICPARDLFTLIRSDPFRDAPDETKDLRHYVTIMTRAPRTLPPLPLEKPDGKKWEVKLIAITGRFALGLWRRQTNGILYPNAVVEKHFGIPATTRNWNTITSINDILKMP
jgi:uncharacterized protein (DUF1697 family)